MGITKHIFTGDLVEISTKIAEAKLPKVWGDTKLIKSWAKDHIPTGRGWHGLVEIAGYRTDPQAEPRGTVFISVTWRVPGPDETVIDGEQR